MRGDQEINPPPRSRVIRPAELEELAQPDGVPPGIHRGLIRPLPEGTLPLEGTVGLPQIGQTFELARSGLAVPSSPPRLFSDDAVSYLSLQEDFGETISEEEIIAQLEELPLRQVLWVLAQATHRADRALNDVEAQKRLCRAFVPAALLPRALGLLESPSRAAISPQVSLALAQRALVHAKGAEEVTESEFDELVRKLGLMVLALGHHITPPRGPDHLTLELARTDLFFRLWGHTEWYRVAEKLFFETLPSLSSRKDWIDVGQVIEDAFGISLEDFWSLTVAMGIASFGQDHPMRFPVVPQGVMAEDTVRRWEQAWTIGLEEAQRLAEDDLGAEAPWLFRSFMDRPILDTGQLRFAPRPHFLSEKGGPTGMFWAVSRAYVQLGGDHRKWATLFGHAVEAQARRSVEAHVGDRHRLWDEKALKERWGKGSVCDLVAVYPETWIAFEFRHRVASVQTRATGDMAALVHDMRLAAIDKFGQIDDALARGFANDPAPPNKVFPVVVIGAHFPTNPLVTRTLLDEVAKQSAVLTRDPRCKTPAVLDIFELGNALELARATGRMLPDVLEEWLDGTDGRVGFRRWLGNEGPGIRQPADRAWVDHVVRRLFGKDAVRERH